MKGRPQSGEFPAHFERYIALVPDGDLLEALALDRDQTLAMLREAPADKHNFRYAPDKWSVKEALGHISDTERIMAYRVLRIARGDHTPLPGFEEKSYVVAAESGRLSLAQLIDEFAVVREATLQLLRLLPDDAWGRTGEVGGHAITARAMAYVLAGHARHHAAIIRDRYLNS